MDLPSRLTTAYGRFITEMEGAASDPEMPHRAAIAYGEYVACLADASNEPQLVEVNRLFERYRQVIQDGFSNDDSSARIRGAFEAFLMDVKAAWAEMDPQSFAPTDLISVGQSLASLAWLVETSQEGAGVPSPDRDDEIANNGRGSSLWGSTSLLEDLSSQDGVH